MRAGRGGARLAFLQVGVPPEARPFQHALDTLVFQQCSVLPYTEKWEAGELLWRLVQTRARAAGRVMPVTNVVAPGRQIMATWRYGSGLAVPFCAVLCNGVL